MSPIKKSDITESEDKNHSTLFDNDEYMNPYDTDVICLSVGSLGPSLLKKCVPIFEEATKHRMTLEKENAYLFQYGTTSGLWEYRNELSKFLTKRYGEKVNRQDLILTCGATQGLVFILNNFIPHDGVIFVEETSYMGSLDIFKMFTSMKLVPVPMTNDGLDTVALEKIVLQEKCNRRWNLTEGKMFWAMLYIIPVFHNPTSITSSQKCCERIITIARKNDFLVVSDDVYNLVYYGNEKYPPRRLYCYDRYSEGYCGGNVISIGSFSKILSPGIRIGWLEAGPRMAKTLRKSKILASSGAVNQYMSGIMASILELGLMDIHLDYLVNVLKVRMQSLCNTLDKHLPENCSYKKPDGGYFVWLQLPESVDATNFNSWCIKKYKVDAKAGKVFSINENFQNYLRLSVGFHESEIIKQAAENLCCGIIDYIENEINS